MDNIINLQVMTNHLLYNKSMNQNEWTQLYPVSLKTIPQCGNRAERRE